MIFASQLRMTPPILALHGFPMKLPSKSSFNVPAGGGDHQIDKRDFDCTGYKRLWIPQNRVDQNYIPNVGIVHGPQILFPILPILCNIAQAEGENKSGSFFLSYFPSFQSPKALNLHFYLRFSPFLHLSLLLKKVFKRATPLLFHLSKKILRFLYYSSSFFFSIWSLPSCDNITLRTRDRSTISIPCEILWSMHRFGELLLMKPSSCEKNEILRFLAQQLGL